SRTGLPPRLVPRAFVKCSSDDLCFYTVHFMALVYGVLDMPSLYRLATRVSPPRPHRAEFEAAARRIVDEYARAEPGCTLAAAGECARLLSSTGAQRSPSSAGSRSTMRRGWR